MRHECGPYLSTRPPFLLPTELPYDDLLRSPERFTGRPGRTSGCTFGSVDMWLHGVRAAAEPGF
jgi:hypothetical protein